MLGTSYINIYFPTLFLLLSITSIAVHMLNPFGNSCVKGNCENNYGTYQYSSGMKYSGEWKNGRRHGQGTLVYPDGSKYTGEWQMNKMHGKGIKIYASDKLYSKYNGEWKNGNKHGKGTAIYSGGTRYEGYWEGGQMHGKGTIRTIDGRTVAGEWKNGVLFGTVTEVYPDGRILVVETKNEVKHGHGVTTYPDGTKIKGEWINNKLLGSLEFYLFRGIEFENRYSVERLCNAIKADIGISLEAPENTVLWLNELLKVPNLHEEFNEKIQVTGSTKKIDMLFEHINNYRYRRFSELDINDQKNIVKLNRLLIEHLYLRITPKSKRY